MVAIQKPCEPNPRLKQDDPIPRWAIKELKALVVENDPRDLANRIEVYQPDQRQIMREMIPLTIAALQAEKNELFDEQSHHLKEMTRLRRERMMSEADEVGSLLARVGQAIGQKQGIIRKLEAALPKLGIGQ